MIERQQRRVQARYPDEPESHLKLLPARMKNPHGTKGLYEGNLGARHRQWVNNLPDVEIAVTRGGEPVTELLVFNKASIFPYAYRTPTRSATQTRVCPWTRCAN